MAFSPDGATVATGAADGTVRLHDVATHQTRNSLTAGFTPAVSIAFAPDGHTLAVATLDGTTRLYSFRLPDITTATTTVCTALSRDLTPQERNSYVPPGPVGPGCAGLAHIN
ncbi:hypothetical protein NYE86_00910 [Actinacidiphila bryophytorum]|nr:hypothetical protein NYE86_00910 [Actinacidiphila bryophytorum]